MTIGMKTCNAHLLKNLSSRHALCLTSWFHLLVPPHKSCTGMAQGHQLCPGTYTGMRRAHLGLGVAEHAEQRGLARIGHADDPAVRDQLQLQLQPHLGALIAHLRQGGRAVRVRDTAKSGRAAALKCSTLAVQAPSKTGLPQGQPAAVHAPRGAVHRRAHCWHAQPGLL